MNGMPGVFWKAPLAAAATAFIVAGLVWTIVWARDQSLEHPRMEVVTVCRHEQAGSDELICRKEARPVRNP